MAHLDEMGRDPKFPIMSSDQMRRLLGAPAPEVFIVVPRRMYERMRAEAGDALRPDPIYQDLGAGLFLRPPRGRAPMAPRDALHPPRARPAARPPGERAPAA